MTIISGPLIVCSHSLTVRRASQVLAGNGVNNDKHGYVLGFCVVFGLYAWVTFLGLCLGYVPGLCAWVMCLGYVLGFCSVMCLDNVLLLCVSVTCFGYMLELCA